MPSSDLLLVFQWCGALFLVGAAAYPLTRALKLPYLFSKAVGLAVVTFLVYLGAILHLVPFTQLSIYFSLFVVFVLGVFLNKVSRSEIPLRGSSIWYRGS